MADCEHHIRETLQGAGPCRIEFEVKLRNGRPNWWCRTHGQAAHAPDGNALDQCPGAWFDPVPDEQRLELMADDGEVAIWGALDAAIKIGSVPAEPGKVHVHRRAVAGGSKDIDRSYDIVVVRAGEESLIIEGMAAVAYSISELSGRQVTALTCPQCGEVHIDELKFATFPHAKHLCNSCGRSFWDRTQPSISNPLADAAKQLGLPQPPPPERAQRPLDMSIDDYRAVALWPSNSAIVSTMTRPEEEGIHVHAWDNDENLVIDETYSPITLDGVLVAEDHLRLLAVQRTLAHGAPVMSRPCGGCGTSLASGKDSWLEPVTQHTCTKCGTVTQTSRKVFLNPLAEQ